MKIHVVGDHQVEIAIMVVITEGSTGGPAAVGDAGFLGYVSESSVAVVAIENVATEAGDIQVGPAIIVVIAHGATHGELAGRSDAGFISDVGKSAVVIVVIQRAARGLALERAFDAGGVSEVNVGPAIAVVINEQHAAAHALDDVLFLGRRLVMEVDTSLGRDVYELRHRAGTFLAGFDDTGLLAGCAGHGHLQNRAEGRYLY